MHTGLWGGSGECVVCKYGDLHPHCPGRSAPRLCGSQQATTFSRLFVICHLYMFLIVYLKFIKIFFLLFHLVVVGVFLLNLVAFYSSAVNYSSDVRGPQRYLWCVPQDLCPCSPSGQKGFCLCACLYFGPGSGTQSFTDVKQIQYRRDRSPTLWQFSVLKPC